MTNETLIRPARILLPDADIDMEKWACLACDQFTSQPEYWHKAQTIVGENASALGLILPEVYLDEPDVANRIEQVHAQMRRAVSDYLKRVVNGFIYTERTTESGTRKGLLAAIDLEAYSYTPGQTPLIRPTEGTVPSRIPPRLAVRRGALLELPHILMLLNDPDRTVLEPLAEKKASLPLLYDTPLMLGGGRVAGWAVEDPALVEQLIRLVQAFAEKLGPNGAAPIAIAVGDGNHSLATAKAYWEELKTQLPEAELADHPARWALAEIENVYDDAIQMEPIHRVVFGVDTDAFTRALAEYCASRKGCGTPQRFSLVCCGKPDAEFVIEHPEKPLCVGSLEDFLADYLPSHPAARVDYIHGEEAVRELAGQNAVGILAPPFYKEDLFRGVYEGGVLPKKTFSMGHATEKRYYLECRQIAR